MNKNKLREFQRILHYLPTMGVSIVDVAKELGVSATSLYNYRNGLVPKEEKYRYILASLYSLYTNEMNKISILLQYEREEEAEVL